MLVKRIPKQLSRWNSFTTSTPKHPLPRDSFDPVATEAGRYQWWSDNNKFKPSKSKSRFKKTFSMILPPPNVTGVLHVGHALTVALQDSLARWRRMRGDRVLWVPGLDHAGIATQSVVEKRLAATSNGTITRHDLGRETFLKQVWEWREEHGRRIVLQLQGLGASLDWEEEFFTLDEIRSKAVVEAFVRLHEAGLVYRRERHVNWCCALQTTISDIEVDRTPLRQGGERLGPIPGHDSQHTFQFGAMSRFAYPIVDEFGKQTGEELVVATTRLETMLGDVAVAVHPEDVRYQHLHGKRVLHPLRSSNHPYRTMPIVTDNVLVDPTLGTGAVKITPAHDPEDHACAERVLRRQTNVEDLPLNWEVFDESGNIVQSCIFHERISVGMPRYEAREEVEKVLKELDLWREEEEEEEEKVEEGEEKSKEGKENNSDSKSSSGEKEKAKKKKKKKKKKQKDTTNVDGTTILPRCSRSGDIVEPRLLPQWYVRTSDASLSGAASNMGNTMIDGDRHVKEWSRWLDGDDDAKQDWCVSRQLWWGHRIPAWKITNLQYETEKNIDIDGVIKEGSWLRTLLLNNNDDENKGDDDIQWIVARTKKDAEKMALEKIWQETNDMNVPISWYFDLKQDEDVLDTWFSSGILPLSSLGWPFSSSSSSSTSSSSASTSSITNTSTTSQDNQMLSDFYPLSVMETGSDILFFWVARMAMLCSFLDSQDNQGIVRAPFERVLLHPMVRDKRGRKMSKSLGNVIDPLDITKGASLENLTATLNANTNMTNIERKMSLKDLNRSYPNGIPECGVDGLRFALCSYLDGTDMSSTINLDVQRAVSARHMCNKLWNASKFILSSSASESSIHSIDSMDKKHLRLIDRWMLSRVATCVKNVNANMEDFKMTNVTMALRNHLIHELCDVYIELSKREPHLPSVQHTLMQTLSTYLVMLHPIMPYVTEDIYLSMQQMKQIETAMNGSSNGSNGSNGSNTISIMNEQYPVYEGEWDQWYDSSAENDFNSAVAEPARAVRSLRKLAADVFGKDVASGSYVELSTVETVDTVGTVESSFSELLTSNIENICQLSRHPNVQVVAELNKTSISYLSRTLIMSNGASVVVRIYLPSMSETSNGNEEIAKELKRLNGKRKKVDKQLQKLQMLTSRSTYQEEAPLEIRIQHKLKIAELEADTLDIEATTSILKEF